MKRIVLQLKEEGFSGSEKIQEFVIEISHPLLEIQERPQGKMKRRKGWGMRTFVKLLMISHDKHGETCRRSNHRRQKLEKRKWNFSKKEAGKMRR